MIVITKLRVSGFMFKIRCDKRTGPKLSKSMPIRVAAGWSSGT